MPDEFQLGFGIPEEIVDHTVGSRGHRVLGRLMVGDLHVQPLTPLREGTANRVDVGVQIDQDLVDSRPAADFNQISSIDTPAPLAARIPETASSMARALWGAMFRRWQAGL